MKKRVVITGIGAVTPSGTGKEAIWNSTINGISSAQVSEKFVNNELPVKIACEVKDFEPKMYLKPRTIMCLDRQAQFAFVSAKMAIDDSNLQLDSMLSDKTGVFEGTALASLNTNFERHCLYLKEGIRKISPFALLNGLTGNASAAIASEYKLHGPAVTFSSGCVSSSYAIGYGFRKIQHGELTIAIAGGAEAPVSKEIIGMFSKASLLSTQNDKPGSACKPFDLCRDGFVLGEGGAFLVLEELEHALNRNADIYAELIGFGETTDAFHPSSPEPGGKFYVNAMEFALTDAGITTEEIEYINVHGTATKLNDVSETNAIKNTYKENSANIAVSSTKPVTGHLLGACGSIELIITSLAIKNGLIPPTANLENIDPACNLNVINAPIKKEINYAMSNNLSFGGRNSSIIIKRFLSNSKN